MRSAGRLGRVRWGVCLWAFAAGVGTAAPVSAQSPATPPLKAATANPTRAGTPANAEPGAAPPTKPVKKPHQTRFIGMPIPIYNPQLDFALGAMAMLTYPLVAEDVDSPPSSTSLFGMIATNKSYLLAGQQQLYWDHDNNRAALAFGGGHFNSDFYGTGDMTSAGLTFPLGTYSLFVMTKYLRRVWNRLYLGGKYQLLLSSAVLEAPSGASDELTTYFPVEQNDRNSGLGVVGEYDSRDNRFSATRGFYVPLNTTFYAKAFGGNVNHSRVDLAYNSYHALYREELILAVRGALQFAFGNTPFYLLPAVGNGPDLRGYASGRYRDHLFFDAQAELRWYFWRGFGAVVFAGVGSTTSGFDALFSGTVLPSYGLGVRYMLHQDQRLVLRIDYGRGNEDGMFYFSVSEAF